MKIVKLPATPCTNPVGTRNISVDFFNEKKHFITKVIIEEFDSDKLHEYISSYTRDKDGEIDVNEPIKIVVNYKDKTGKKLDSFTHNTYGMVKISLDLLQDIEEIEELFESCHDKKVYM